MADYNLDGLSHRSFEQMTQALCLDHLSKDCSVFGDGPDGGREATFEGIGLYPQRNAPWSGYHVVQAKFKQTQTSSLKVNADWLIAQINSEFERWEKNTTRRRPDYYILITNVRLSGVESTGGKDRVARIAAKWKKKLGIREISIWDYDKIARFLDASSEVRRSYLGYIAVGDVLKALTDSLDRSKRSLEFALNQYLQRELREDTYARLEQAGDQTDARIPLARVFVDLPASFSQPQTDVHGARRQHSSFGAVKWLVKAGASNHSPSTSSKNDISQAKIVLVGGPGQGKTTLGQYLCQLYRLAFLSRRDKLQLEEATTEAMDTISTQCEIESIQVPSNCRFPVRVVLSRYAEWLAKREAKESTALNHYICELVNTRSTMKIEPDSLTEWFSISPWLLVLDGLDEVPASSNRGQLLDSITDFLGDMRALNSDLLVVSTTRPQGYNEDFSPRFFRHIWLLPLEPQEAIQYGSRLLAAKHGLGTSRFDETLKKLKEASENETTKRLMTTPLQVTILVTIVEHSGTPPSDRWKLFHQYYEVIYRREQEKGTSVSRLLLDHKQHIDDIHYHVGFVLQRQGQERGSTDSSLSLKTLCRIVRERFSSEGFEGDELNALVKEASDAATDRLVFLVAPKPDRVGFEIRSLQEFMAAQYLTSCDDSLTLERLTAILSSPYWRNTWLFAAGKCFAERQYLRDSIVVSVAAANLADSELPLEAVLYGSQVAIELLADGSVYASRRHYLILLELGLRSAELVADSLHVTLAELYEDRYEAEYQRALATSTASESTTGRYLLLAALAERGIGWADRVLNDWWSKASMEARFNAAYGQLRFNISWHKGKGDTVWLDVDSDKVFSQHLFFYGDEDREKDLLALIDIRRRISEVKSYRVIFEEIPFELTGHLNSLHGASNSIEIVDAISSDHGHWKVCKQVALLDAMPSKVHLAALVQSILDNGLPQELRFISRTWISWWAIRAIAKGAKPSSLLSDIYSGKCGDTSDWLDFEEAILANGLRIDRAFNLTIPNCTLNGTLPLELFAERLTAKENIQEIIANIFALIEQRGDEVSSKYALIVNELIDSPWAESLTLTLSQASFMRFADLIRAKGAIPFYLHTERFPCEVTDEVFACLERTISEDGPTLFVRKEWHDSLCKYVNRKPKTKLLRSLCLRSYSAENELPCRMETLLASEDLEDRWAAFVLDFPYLLRSVQSDHILAQFFHLGPRPNWQIEEVMQDLAESVDTYPTSASVLTSIVRKSAEIPNLEPDVIFSSVLEALSRIKPQFKEALKLPFTVPDLDYVNE